MIELKNVSKWYGPVQVLNECSATISKGEVVVVCGPSGSGKSTLIKTINALEPFQKGEITVDGIKLHDPKTDLPKLRSRVGMVFQHFELFPHLSVTDNLTIAQIKVLGRTADDAKKRGLKMLERVGLIAHKDKFPGQLSGGQQQRVAIARALSMDPIVMLFDEPTWWTRSWFPIPWGTFTPPPAPGPAIWPCTRTTAISIASTNSTPPSIATTGRRTDR